MAQKLGAQKLAPVATTQRLRLEVPDTRDQAARLADSLDEFGRKVVGIAVRKTTEAAAKQRGEGERAAAQAIAEGKDTIEEMVEAGIIDRGANPFFRDGVLFMVGQARADAFNARLTIAAAEAGLHDSTDPNAMDDLIESISGEFSGEEDEAILSGFSEKAAGFATQQKERHARIVATNISKVNDDLPGTRFRGILLDSIEASPENVVANYIEKATEFSGEWLGNLGRVANKGDKRRLNDALVGSIVTGVAGGEITGLQAETILRGISPGTGTLWGVDRHAEAVRTAITKRAARVQSAYQSDLLSRQKVWQQSETAATSNMWSGYNEDTGELSTVAIEAAVVEAARTGQPAPFRPGYVVQMQQVAKNVAASFQRGHLSNVDLFNRTLTDVLRPDSTQTRDSILNLVDGTANGINATDAKSLIDTLEQQRNMALNNPREQRMWAFAYGEVTKALGGFMPNQFTTQAMVKAHPELIVSFNTFRADHPTADYLSEDYAEWLKSAKLGAQDRHLDETSRRTMQRRADLNVAASETEVWRTQAFETDTTKMVRLYAEATWALEHPNHIFSDELIDLFDVAGGEVTDNAAMQAATYVSALAGQLALAGIPLSSGSVKDEIEEQQKRFAR